MLFTDNGKLTEMLGRKAIGPSDLGGSQFPKKKFFYWNFGSKATLMIIFTRNGKLIERLGRKAIGPSNRVVASSRKEI